VMEQTSDQELYMVNSFEEFVDKGGDILSFTDYYNASHYHIDFEPIKEAILITLCEEYALIENYVKIFQLLDVSFNNDVWTERNFRYFIYCVKESELLRPLYTGIKMLYQKSHYSEF
jgi:hypothetical protein